MFKVLRKVFKINKKVADTPHINDPIELIRIHLINFNSNEFRQTIQEKRGNK